MPEGSAPRVLSWEQLSRYRGFKAEGVEAGFNASIAMIVSHSQQVFSPSPDSGQDMSNQVGQGHRSGGATYHPPL